MSSSEPTKGSCFYKKPLCVCWCGTHCHHMKTEMPGLSGIRESSEVAMTSLTSTILPRPLTFCNLSTFKQTLSGSWKYKCQLFPHENSCDLDPGGKQGLVVSFSLSFLLLSDLFPLFLFIFPMISSYPLLYLSLPLSLPPCVCNVAHRTCPLACRQRCGNLVWQLLRTMACGCFVM